MENIGKLRNTGVEARLRFNLIQDAVKDLREAYAFISLTTNMPYVECEEVDYNDQIHLFARKEDAESMQKELEADVHRRL